jgi:hypothetical protein
VQNCNFLVSHRFTPHLRSEFHDKLASLSVVCIRAGCENTACVSVIVSSVAMNLFDVPKFIPEKWRCITRKAAAASVTEHVPLVNATLVVLLALVALQSSGCLMAFAPHGPSHPVGRIAGQSC